MGIFLMSLSLENLPEVIFGLLGVYLSPDDYAPLISLNRQFCRIIRRRNLYFSLNLSNSLKFLSDEKFRHRILNPIESPNQQICLTIGYCNYSLLKNDFLSLIHCIKWNNEILRKVPFPECAHFFSHVQVMKHLCTENIVTFPFYNNLKELQLEYCSNLTNLQHLSQLRKLELIDCANVSDIRSLAQIPELKIINCNQIVDFSSLGRQRVLEIFECEGLTDVRSLATVQRLSIGFCPNVGSLAALHGVHDLSLMYLDQITDYAVLGNHFRLTIITGNHEATGYEAVLASTPHIGIGCPIITQLYSSHRSVTIYENSCIADYAFLLPVTSSLSIVGTRNFHDILPIQISYFQHLTYLSLTSCDIRNVNGLGNIYHLCVESCSELTDIAALGGNHTIRLSYCPGITDVSSLRTVMNVTIINCDMIRSYDCLATVPRLKITCRRKHREMQQPQFSAM